MKELFSIEQKLDALLKLMAQSESQAIKDREKLTFLGQQVSGMFARAQVREDVHFVIPIDSSRTTAQRIDLFSLIGGPASSVQLINVGGAVSANITVNGEAGAIPFSLSDSISQEVIASIEVLPVTPGAGTMLIRVGAYSGDAY